MPDIIVKPIEQGDIEDLTRVYLRAISSRERAAGRTPPDGDKIFTGSLETWRDIHEGLRGGGVRPHCFLGAFEDGKLKGFVWGADPVNADIQGAGEINALFVDPEAQGQGVGRALFNEAARFLKEQGLNEIYLWTDHDNSLARAFYKARGGELVPDRIFRREDGFHGVMFRWGVAGP